MIKYLLLHSAPSSDCQHTKFYPDSGMLVFKASEELTGNGDRTSYNYIKFNLFCCNNALQIAARLRIIFSVLKMLILMFYKNANCFYRGDIFGRFYYTIFADIFYIIKFIVLFLMLLIVRCPWYQVQQDGSRIYYTIST